MSVAALKRLRLAPDWWTRRDEVRYRWRTVRRWFRRRQAGARFAKWVRFGIGLAFWVFIVLAFVRSPWWWLSAGVAFVCNLVLMLAGARDVLAELVKLPQQDQAGGAGSTNYQAGGDVIVSAGIPEGSPSAERGQFWLGLGGHSATVETVTDREARERADFELLAARLKHPAGRKRP